MTVSSVLWWFSCCLFFSAILEKIYKDQRHHSAWINKSNLHLIQIKLSSLKNCNSPYMGLYPETILKLQLVERLSDKLQGTFCHKVVPSLMLVKGAVACVLPTFITMHSAVTVTNKRLCPWFKHRRKRARTSKRGTLNQRKAFLHISGYNKMNCFVSSNLSLCYAEYKE